MSKSHYSLSVCLTMLMNINAFVIFNHVKQLSALLVVGGNSDSSYYKFFHYVHSHAFDSFAL